MSLISFRFVSFARHLIAQTAGWRSTTSNVDEKIKKRLAGTENNLGALLLEMGHVEASEILEQTAVGMAKICIIFPCGIEYLFICIIFSATCIEYNFVCTYSHTYKRHCTSHQITSLTHNSSLVKHKQPQSI